MFDEDGWSDDEPWDTPCMPGYEEGDWPPRDDLGMADIFTDDQVNLLIGQCEAKVIDNMGGNGESLTSQKDVSTGLGHSCPSGAMT